LEFDHLERIKSQDSNFDFFLRQVRTAFQYQFGLSSENARKMFPSTCEILRSKKTGKVRFISIGEDLICTLKPTDGLIKLSLQGANSLLKLLPPPKLRIIVRNDVASFIREGKNVFAKHVRDVDVNLRPKSEVIIVDEEDNLLGIGTLLLIKREIKDFKRGVAAHTRHGMKKLTQGIVSIE
jgi:predicted RNA-binding protein (TIGR00451 family)